MKTYKNLYRNLLNRQHIKEVLLTVSSEKKKYKRRIATHIDAITDEVYWALRWRKVEMSPTINKIVHDRKKDRQITLSPWLPNKAFDYLLTDQLKPIIARSMYHWCTGNVKGRGEDVCLHYCEKQAREYKYCLQIDIRKFYDNIDRAILYAQVARKVSDRAFLNFYCQVVGNSGKGLPLGLNSSQWLANFYLQDFDNYLKQKIKVPAMVRHVDNVWIFGNNKRKMHFWLKQIMSYLHTELQLTLKENYQILSLEKGDELDVLGYKVSKGFTRLNKPTLYRTVRLYYRMGRRKSFRRARTIVSLMWLKRTTNYTKYLFKLISKAKITLKRIKQIVGEGSHVQFTKHRRRAIC